MQTRCIILTSRPRGLPRLTDFQLATMELPPLAEGEFLLENQFLSMDAGVRAFLDETPGYLQVIGLGETVRGMAIGQVMDSRHADYPVGTVLRAFATWAEHSVITADAMGLERITPDPRVRLQTYMGALGPVGTTAWIGLHEIGRIRPGETVLVSAAAGATGSVAVQLAAFAGCRVIGLASTPDKIAWLHELGVDAAIDYRATPDLAAAITACAPDGIDVFFDNVGGQTLELVLPLMREQGRVVVCGMISQYNNEGAPYGVKTLWQIVTKRLTLRGFLTFDHADRLPEATAELERLAIAGRLHSHDAVYEGLPATPQAFIDLMSGKTQGKTLVRVG